jgi:predicted 3-demethylubiquinone-9 3-methyltransferase (glyoxalase superfamily)
LSFQDGSLGSSTQDPFFKFTPAVSFLVACDTEEEVDALWNELSKEGSVFMELGEYRLVRDMDGRRIDTASRGR